jgi:chaperonin GroES
MNDAKFHPLHDRVLLRIEDDEQTTPGGLFLPETAREISTFARVVAVGPGKLDDEGRRHKPIVEVGARVILDKLSRPVLIDWNGERDKHLVARMDEIAAEVAGDLGVQFPNSPRQD